MHVFCCVLALALCGLLQRELSRAGIRRPVPAILAELGAICEVDVLYPPREGRCRARAADDAVADERRAALPV